MHPFFNRPGVRRVRILFRWCRIFIWLILFLALAAVSYLHLVGFPDFLKQPMLQRLLAEGIEARFTNMQLGWGRGPSIVIENAAFSHFHQPLSPRLTTSRAELTLNWDALLHAQIDLHSLQISGAQLQLPVSETNGDVLVFNNVALDMRFFSNDVVRLDYCRGAFRDIQIDLIGGVNHVSMLQHWKFPLGGGTANVPFQARLQQVAQTVEKIHFTGTPLLQIQAGADGGDMNSFRAEMNLVTSAARTPWGDVTNLVMKAACARLADPGHEPFLQVKWSAMGMTTPWARSRRVSCLTTFSRGANSNLVTDIRLDATQFNATLDSVGSNSFGAARFSWNGSVTLASLNSVPLLVAGKLRATEPRTPWGSAHDLSLECRAGRSRNLPPPDAGWGPWTSIAPWTLDWQADMRNMASPKLCFDHLDFSGHWRAPQVVIKKFQGDLYGGHVNAGAILDIGSRELRCNGVTDFNPHSISNCFNPAARDWMAQLDWMTPPKVNVRLRVVLPPWINRPARWSSDMASSLQLAGDFTVGPASFRQVSFHSGAAHVTYTNRTWNVSHLRAVRPDGDINMDYSCNEITQDYRYLIDSRLDPKDALPLLESGQQHILDDFVFKQSPHIRAEIRGCLRAPGSTGFTAAVLATNFIARGETVAAFNAGVEYTNLILNVDHLSLSNDQCQVQAPWIQADFGTKMVRLTNATGTLDPALLQRVLHDNPPDFLSYVHFDKPPSASVFGSFSLTNAQAVDLHFFVSGRRLHYAGLLADRATGGVDWTGPTVALTNITASLYNGMVTGWIVFNSPPKQGSDFRANFNARNIDLSSVAVGITGKTNHVEGRLDGHVTLGGPNSPDRSQWQGQGSIYVHDALLWDIKLFGLFSPVLNAISPGWGHSRAREATADFVITNGTTSSDNLEMRCQGFRLELRGAVDTNKQINARFEADLSRDAPVVGSLLSTMFTPLSKLFEYHISGSLHDPVMEPVYVPKFIMLLLHPFHAIKTITEPSPAPGKTK